MPKNLLVFLIHLMLGAFTTGTQAAPALHTAVPKDNTKPTTPSFAPVRTPFDCTGRDTLTLAPGLVDTLRGDTTDGRALLDGYACVEWPEAGREHIYRLEVTETLELWAGLREVDPATDLDLFLLDGCDSDQCLVGANVEFSALLEAGTYWLSVDGFGATDSTNIGPYALALETRWPGLPPAVCATDSLLACAVGDLPGSGNLFGTENLLQTADCSPHLLRGGEIWYALQVQAAQTVTITTAVADSLDVALWLFAACGVDPACLAFADDVLAGEPETIVWNNQELADVTVYLGVDSPRPLTSAEQGAFLLNVNCGDDVPVSKTSFGGLRALYR